MSSKLRLARSVLLLPLLLGTLSGVCCAKTQSPFAIADQEDDRLDSLSLSVFFAEDGTARVSLITPQYQSSPEVQAVIESSLQCIMSVDAPFRSRPSAYQGTCSPAFTRDGTLRQFRILTAPLRKFAQDHKIDAFYLTVQLPDDEIAETNPPAPAQSALDAGNASADLQRLNALYRVYSWKADGAIPEVVTVRFGISARSATRTEGIMLGVFLLPALLIFWMGRKALASEAQDKAVVWFTYMRYLQWTLNFALLGWWIAADALHLADLLRLFSTGTLFAPLWNYPVTPVMVDWLPPMILWMICFALSHPVQEKLRGLTWTRRELALQAFYSCCASLVPIAMALTGITSLANSARAAVLWFLAAFFTRIVAVRARAKFLGMQPQALTTGELRDRAFAMAKQLGVKLQQIYIIPSGKGQMVNAFARNGNVISFTDFLLQRMNRREVNFVLGHELSHLKLGHPGKLALAGVISYFAALFAVGFADPFLHLSVVVRYSLIVAIVTLAPYFCSRRFEYAADAGAVAATGDPQAAISALFKIAQLNMLPIHWSKWSEKWLTHPSSLRRAQAIARKGGIPPEHVTTIAQGAAGPDEGYYVLPATVAPGSKVHSTQAKQGGSLTAAWLMLVAIIFTPALFALAAAHSGSNTAIRLTIYLAGIAGTVGAYFLCANFVPPMRLPGLVAALKDKFAKERVQTDAWDGVFVGFSPAAAPRSYELNTNWDLGCFFLRSDRVCYWGEETKFCLRRNQITSVKLAPGMPGLLRPWRVYIAWKDEERATSGVFNIGCINGASTLGLRQQTSRLAERLHLWWKSAAAEKPCPEPLSALTTPQIGLVTGAIPGKAMRSNLVVKEIVYVAVFAVIGAVLCGLPFHLLAFLLAAADQTFRQFNSVHSPGAGWYVVAVAVVMRVIAMIALMRYKDVAIVTLAPSNTALPTASAGRATQAETKRIEKESVLTR